MKPRLRSIVGWIYLVAVCALAVWLGHILHQKQQAEARSERRIKMLAAVVETSPVAVIISGGDEGDMILHWNHAAEDLLGWTSKEMLNQSIFKIMPEDVLQTHRRLLSDPNVYRELLSCPLTLRCDVLTKSQQLIEVQVTVVAAEAEPAKFITRLQDPQQIRDLGSVKSDR